MPRRTAKLRSYFPKKKQSRYHHQEQKQKHKYKQNKLRHRHRRDDRNEMTMSMESSESSEYDDEESLTNYNNNYPGCVNNIDDRLDRFEQKMDRVVDDYILYQCRSGDTDVTEDNMGVVLQQCKGDRGAHKMKMFQCRDEMIPNQNNGDDDCDVYSVSIHSHDLILGGSSMLSGGAPTPTTTQDITSYNSQQRQQQTVRGATNVYSYIPPVRKRGKYSYNGTPDAASGQGDRTYRTRNSVSFSEVDDFFSI